MVGKNLKVVNSYTMEASFSGMNIGPNKGCHLNIGMLEAIGAHLGENILNLIEENQTKVKEVHEYLLKKLGEDKENEKPKKKSSKSKKSSKRKQ